MWSIWYFTCLTRTVMGVWARTSSLEFYKDGKGASHYRWRQALGDFCLACGTVQTIALIPKFYFGFFFSPTDAGKRINLCGIVFWETIRNNCIARTSFIYICLHEALLERLMRLNTSAFGKNETTQLVNASSMHIIFSFH